MPWRRLLFACPWAAGLLLAAGLAGAQPNTPAPLRFIAPINNTMPIADFDSSGRLVGGISKDLAELIAARLGRPAVFIALPSKRVSAALSAGEGDAICYVLPEWLQGDFHWTRPLIPDASLVAAAEGAPEIKALADLAGEPLGTVLGYTYPRVEAALGERLQRREVATMALNLRRLAAGRVRYAMVEKTALDDFLRGQPGAPVRVAWVVERFEARCAFSKRGALPFAEVSRAVDKLATDGSLDKLLARYR
jgi:polar amino acid transport system substrate-binding protein